MSIPAFARYRIEEGLLKYFHKSKNFRAAYIIQHFSKNENRERTTDKFIQNSMLVAYFRKNEYTIRFKNNRWNF